MVSLALSFLLAPVRAQTAPVLDAAYFDGASARSLADLRGVVEILLSHSSKPSAGVRRLPVQPSPDPDAEPSIDCEDLEPVPPPRHPSRMVLCGIRLLRWTLGEDADRVELPVVGERQAGERRWLELLLDPASGRRGWVQFMPPRRGVEFMTLRPLSDWVAGSGTVLLRGAGGRRLDLRDAPSFDAERSGPPVDLRQDVRASVLGMQGDWIRVSLDDPECSREEPGGGPAGTDCPAGWILWRSESGAPLVLP